MGKVRPLRATFNAQIPKLPGNSLLKSQVHPAELITSASLIWRDCELKQIIILLCWLLMHVDERGKPKNQRNTRPTVIASFFLFLFFFCYAHYLQDNFYNTNDIY